MDTSLHRIAEIIYSLGLNEIANTRVVFVKSWETREYIYLKNIWDKTDDDAIKLEVSVVNSVSPIDKMDVIKQLSHAVNHTKYVISATIFFRLSYIDRAKELQRLSVDKWSGSKLLLNDNWLKVGHFLACDNFSKYEDIILSRLNSFGCISGARDWYLDDEDYGRIYPNPEDGLIYVRPPESRAKLPTLELLQKSLIYYSVILAYAAYDGQNE